MPRGASRPAIARVHAYLMSRMEPLTEREVREALGLSHRAASLALAEAETWGLVERVAEPRRVGSRGPAGTRLPGRRRSLGMVRPGDLGAEAPRRRPGRRPCSSGRSTRRAEAVQARPDDAELVELRNWLSAFLVFVRLFDRAVGIVPRIEPRELERGLQLLAKVSDDTVLRLFVLLEALDDDDLIALVDSMSRLSPTAARRAVGLFGGVLKTIRR